MHKTIHITLALTTALGAAPTAMNASAAGELAGPLVARMVLQTGCIISGTAPPETGADAATSPGAMRIVCSPDVAAPTLSVRTSDRPAAATGLERNPSVKTSTAARVRPAEETLEITVSW